MLTLANNHITSVSREPHRTIINATVDVADEGWGDLLTALHVAWNGWTLKITKVTEIQRDEVRAANRALSTSRRVQIEAEARLGVPVENKKPLTVNVVVAVKTPQELEADIQAAVQKRIDAALLPRRTP